MTSWIGKIVPFWRDARSYQPHAVVGCIVLLHVALFFPLQSFAQVQPVEVGLGAITKSPSIYAGQTVRIKNVSVKRLRSRFSDALANDTVWLFVTPADRPYTCLYTGPAANLTVEPVQDEKWIRLLRLESNETGQVTITAIVDTGALLMKRPRKFRYPGGVPIMDLCWSRPTPPFWLDLIKVEDFSKAVDPDPIIPVPNVISPKPKQPE